VGRGSQGQRTRDGSLPFKDQVAGEGKIFSDSAFPAQRRAFATDGTTDGANTLSGTSLEEAAIDVSSLRPYICANKRYDHLLRSVEFRDSPDGTRVRVAAIDVLFETAF
jgi:hypothetical protein